MLKLNNARMYDYPGTETDLVIHGSKDEIKDLMEAISENQNEIEFEGGAYYVTQMEAHQPKGYGLTQTLGVLGLVVSPLDNLY